MARDPSKVEGKSTGEYRRIVEIHRKLRPILQTHIGEVEGRGGRSE